jgi:hypothetical protein
MDGLLNGVEAYKSDPKMIGGGSPDPCYPENRFVFFQADGRRGGHKEFE